MLNDSQLATAIDCEGYIGINREVHLSGDSKFSAKIGLGMIHPAIPTALSNRFNGPLRVEHNPKGNHDLYRFEMAGNKKVGAVVEALLPFMVVKNKQADNLLEFLTVYRSLPAAVGRRRRTRWELDLLEPFWVKAKALNRPVTMHMDNPREAVLTDPQLAIAIDCEGYMGICRNEQNNRRHHAAKICLSMIHPYIPYALHGRFGCSLRCNRNPKGNYDLHQWDCSGNTQAISVLSVLLPHLVVKKRQAENLMTFLDMAARIPMKHRTQQEMYELDAFWMSGKGLNRPAPATTERDNPVMGSDSLNLQATVGEFSEA